VSTYQEKKIERKYQSCHPFDDGSLHGLEAEKKKGQQTMGFSEFVVRM